MARCRDYGVLVALDEPVLMPAIVELRHTSVSTTGFQDGLGRRSVRFDRELGATLECLHVRPELLAYEHALLAQACALSELADPRIARIRSLDREHGRLVVISEQPRGDRLSEILDVRDGSAAGGIDAAFGFLLQVLPALVKLHAVPVVHGAIAPGRIMVDSFGNVVLADVIFGAALPRLKLSERRLWHELEIAFPAQQPNPPAGVDVAQVALCSLAIALGRRIEAAEPRPALPALIRQVEDLAETRAGGRLADEVRDLYRALLPSSGSGSAMSAAKALEQVREIAVGELAEDACSNAFVEFVCHSGTAAVTKAFVAISPPATAPAASDAFVPASADEPTNETAERTLATPLPRTFLSLDGVGLHPEKKDSPGVVSRARALFVSTPLTWRVGAAAAIIIAVAALAGRSYMQADTATVNAATQPAPEPPSPEPAPAPNPAAPGTGGLTIESQPAGAKVLIDGVHAGQTPLRMNAIAPGRHNVTVISGKSTTKRTVRVEAGRTTVLDLAALTGWVTVQSPVALDIAAGTRKLGTSADRRIALPPGRHVLTVSNAGLGYSAQHTVEVAAGTDAILNVAPTGRVNVNAQPWAEVWIDGARAGETPLANLQVPLGPREFVFKHPQYGERKITRTVSTTPTALTVDFTKSPQLP